MVCACYVYYIAILIINSCRYIKSIIKYSYRLYDEYIIHINYYTRYTFFILCRRIIPCTQSPIVLVW